MTDRSMTGRLIGVGVGPGDPELLTMKAVRALAEADVVAHFAKAGNDSNARAIVANRSVVEARARAELWVSPWLTAGVSVGSNVLEKNDWMAGLYFGIHSRAFAGTR